VLDAAHGIAGDGPEVAGRAGGIKLTPRRTKADIREITSPS
jgi:hypothetical protein